MIAIGARLLRDLVAEYGGTLDAGLPDDSTIASIGPSDATHDLGKTPDLAPVLHARGTTRLSTNAPVLLVSSSVVDRVPPGRRWVHPNADVVLARLLMTDVGGGSAPDESQVAFDVASGAHVAPDVIIGAGAFIAPGAVIYPRVHIGARVRIGAGSVIGRSGFGFVDSESGALRVPHRGGVLIGHDVEIGALCTIDAGVLSPTTIGRETKIDAQVHVGHGVVIGARCRVAAQVGFAGSAFVEDDVLIGGQAGIGDHVRIGRGARIAGKAGIIGDVPAGAVFAGYPAVERTRWLRGHARLYRR